ncbi:MAG: hybrid sensor histidine kinase/response regulator [Candidatus Thermoplasmatota archaeon]
MKSGNGGPVRLLVVEDDDVFRQFIRAVLTKAGRTGRPISATIVGSLQEALQALTVNRPDCVLLDLGLPDSQGLATLEVLLRSAPGVPVVVLTGAEEDQLADQALLAGAQDFLEKALLKPDSLGRSLRHALDRSGWAAQINAKNRQLEDRNRDLDDFAHAVSHDLKAPLRAAFHLVGQAQEELAEGDADRARQTLAAVEPRIRRLFDMIDGILNITTAGRSSDLVPIDLGSLVRDVLDSLSLPPGFRVHVAPDLPIVLGARASLAQVFQNLIDNAVKHHPRPSGRIDIRWRDTPRAHEICVCDDGAGIPVHQRESVFELFQTLGNEGSTGIGLALVRKVALSAGGDVVIEDNPGGGICFRVIWPKAGQGPVLPTSQQGPQLAA